jgi:hypothetical protein
MDNLPAVYFSQSLGTREIALFYNSLWQRASSDALAHSYISHWLSAIDAESCDIDSISTASAHTSIPAYRALLERYLPVFAAI